MFPSFRSALMLNSRVKGSILPLPVIALAMLGACAIILPLVGLSARVSWTQLPQLLASPQARTALWLSLRTCLAATAITVLLGVPLALVLARQWPGVHLGRTLMVLPMTMPPVVAGIALLATLGRRGLLGAHLDAWGFTIAFSTTAVIIAQVFVSMPYLVVTLEAALRTRDTYPETIARTLGAGPWRVLAWITLPLLTPALARGTALALGRSLGEFGATIAFAGSRQGITRTMPLAIYLERESNTDTSLALAVALIALSFLVVGATTVRWDRVLTRMRVFPASPAAPAAPASEEPGTHTSPSPTGQAQPRPAEDLQISCHLPERDVAITLQAHAGRITALLGPNGSGKSTLCQVAAGLLSSADGQVRLGGKVLAGPDTWVPVGRRGIALLSQSPGIFTHLSVLENVAFGLRCRGVSRERARERARAELAAVGAEHLAARPGDGLSGGQAARVALARALATDPAVLILDEPSAALDVTACQEMRRLVARRAEQQDLTVVLVTHDVLDVAALADDVVVLERGRVVERGPASRVLTTPESGFVAQLTGMAVLTGQLAGTADAPALQVSPDVLIHGRPQEEEPRTGAPGAALIPPEAVALYRNPPQGSPRNVLVGQVSAVEGSGALVSVEVQIAADQALRATVTAGAVAELGIEADQELWAVIKATEVRIMARRAPQGESHASE